MEEELDLKDRAPEYMEEELEGTVERYELPDPEPV